MSRSQRMARHVVHTLVANRGRSLLMMLGVALGVAVLSAVMVLGQGTRDRVTGLVNKHGLDMLMEIDRIEKKQRAQITFKVMKHLARYRRVWSPPLPTPTIHCKCSMHSFSSQNAMYR